MRKSTLCLARPRDRLRFAVADKPLAELAQFAAELPAKLPSARPSEAGIRRGREKLLAELDALQRPRGFGPTSFFFGWIGGLRRLSGPASLAWRVAVVATLLMAGLAFSGALAASADSLPGDPLYDLKRIQEQVRLTITIDGNARQQLQDQIDATRVTELNAIRRLMRVVRTEVSGTVSAVEGDTLVVDQVRFTVDHTQFPAAADVVPGDRVRLVVQTASDGSVTVVEFRREPREKVYNDALGGSPYQLNSPDGTLRPSAAKTATPPAQRAQSFTPIPPAVQPAAKNYLVSTPTPPPPTATPQPSSKPPSPTRETPKQATTTPTGTPTATATRSELHHVPTPTYRPDGTYTPRPTETREPTETRQPTRTREPNETQAPTRTREPTETPEPTDTRRPTPSARPTRTPPPTETHIA